MTTSRNLDPEPDLLLVVIQRLRALVPSITDEQAQQIEATARAELGGLRVRIPKRRKHLTNDQRAEIAREAVNAATSDDELTARHGIHRATLYRYVKRGTGG
ncbi:hypothetical protein [Hydrogenophaga sp. ANAO-22]|uniref:hypothetical protein n=1 Tax=Hydrogenophaga sp. ANAO-22 TaxID=3166645 RepID=UPI0036D27253